MRYRRCLLPGGTYFFTLVTFERKGFLCEPENAELLRQAFRLVCARHPFEIEAFVLLPDHLHCIWTLPTGDDRFSMRWNLIKNAFSRKLNDEWVGAPTASRKARREKGVWQRRFWEHAIRDEEDLRRHVEYIHYNPVKHGYVEAPGAWELSSFRRFVARGVSKANWAGGESMGMDLKPGGE